MKFSILSLVGGKKFAGYKIYGKKSEMENGKINILMRFGEAKKKYKTNVEQDLKWKSRLEFSMEYDNQLLK